jgi:hypothetical protein
VGSCQGADQKGADMPEINYPGKTIHKLSMLVCVRVDVFLCVCACIAICFLRCMHDSSDLKATDPGKF